MARSRPRPIQRFGLLVFGAGFLFLFAVVAITVGMGSPSIPRGDVALVEGVPGKAGNVSRAQLRAGTAQVLAQGGQRRAVPGSEELELAQAEALVRLLKAAWVRGEAAERGISVSTAEARAAIDRFKTAQRYRSEAEFRRYLEAQHLSEGEFESLARLQLLSGLVQESVTDAVPPPSAAAIESYYEAAKAVQFTTSPTYDLRLIASRDRTEAERARAALEEDDSVASWRRLARRYSEDPLSRGRGGLRRSVPAEFGEPLDAAITAAALGAVEGPIRMGRGYVVFAVEGSTPGRVEPLDEVRDSVVNALAKQDREAAVEAFAYRFDAKWESRTYCADGYEVAGCSNYRGSGRPADTPPACYEAHPRAGIAASACPAPVAQAVPAMPGTVTPLTPDGVALPQGPRPQGP